MGDDRGGSRGRRGFFGSASTSCARLSDLRCKDVLLVMDVGNDNPVPSLCFKTGNDDIIYAAAGNEVKSYDIHLAESWMPLKGYSYNKDEINQGVEIIYRTRELEEQQARSRIWNETCPSSFFYKRYNYVLLVKQSLNMEMAIVLARPTDWEDREYSDDPNHVQLEVLLQTMFVYHKPCLIHQRSGSN